MCTSSLMTLPSSRAPLLFKMGPRLSRFLILREFWRMNDIKEGWELLDPPDFPEILLVHRGPTFKPQTGATSSLRTASLSGNIARSGTPTTVATRQPATGAQRTRGPGPPLEARAPNPFSFLLSFSSFHLLFLIVFLFSPLFFSSIFFGLIFLLFAYYFHHSARCPRSKNLVLKSGV